MAQGDPGLNSVEVIDGGGALALQWDDGRSLRFHAIWLRDNALDAASRSPQNGQRLVTLQDIPADTRIAAARIDGGELAVTFAPEGKTVHFPAAWLLAQAYDARPQQRPGWTAPEIETWDAALSAQLPDGDFRRLTRDPDALRA